MRGTIVWLGLPDPIDTLAGLESSADAELLASENLVRGLDELFAALRRGATAGEILKELEVGAKDVLYPTLQAAVEDLFPRLKRGELPTPRQLGNRLRSLRGRNFGGLAIDGKRGNQGVVWTVERRTRDGELPFDDDEEDEP